MVCYRSCCVQAFRKRMVKGIISNRCGSKYSYKYLFLFSAIFGCSCLLFLANNVSEVFLFEDNGIVDSWQEDIDSRCTVRTLGCCIPSLEPFDESIQQFIDLQSKVKSCTPPDFLPLLENNSTHIWVVDDSLTYYNVTYDTEFSCCYRGFYRPEFVEDIRSKDIDKRVKYGPCVRFQNTVEASHEFVNVVCSSGQTSVYEDYFVFTPLKDFSDDEGATPLNSTNAFNVIVMGIDAVSRMNFHRTMPRTLKYLLNKDAVELLGFNKVGDNTFPNLIPLLMGFREEELKSTCFPKKSSTFDNCPLVWDWYKEAGFVTAFGEDSALLATFNYFRVSFGTSPTDYYLYTFIHETENRIGHNKDVNSYLCMGSRYFYRVLLDYVLDLANTLKSMPMFGFFWEVSMSHDYLNYPMFMDESYERFFKSMDELGHLNRTVFALVSDHGIRWGDILQTKQGRMEERLPFVYFLIPPRFREVYPLAYDNMRANSRRLTTPFDIHKTLIDLKDLSSVANEKISSRSREPYSLTGNRGISLFLPVPPNRTCEDAGIDEHWCTCHKSRKLEVDDATVAEGVTFLIDQLNSMLERHRECAPLQLSEVMEASEVEMSASALRHVTGAWRVISVVVRVAPSDALLEATLRRERTGVFTLTGAVSRLNLYGNQSACVDDYRLKLYCYCR